MSVKVALVRCESYDEAAVNDAVGRAVALLGGAEKVIPAGKKILLKPNLLAADPPEAGSTTHFSVFHAAGRVFKEAGFSQSYGDSPAFHTPKTAAEKSGIAAAAAKLSIPLADFETPVEVKFPEGLRNKVFTLAQAVTEGAALVSISKLKVHAFQRFTGAIKNQFGCVPGLRKGEYHVKLPNAYDFARMLVDLNLCLKPALYIMDGVMAMQGNGPRGGEMVPMNVILVSTDAVALDATVCRMLGHDPEMVPTVKYGAEAGLGVFKTDDIELLGDPFSGFEKPDFDIPRSHLPSISRNAAVRAITNLLVPRPVIDSGLCVKCGVCVRMCPVEPKAVDWHDGDKKKPPSYKYDRCIRCYCCQETCPEKAITLEEPWLRRLLVRKARKN